MANTDFNFQPVVQELDIVNQTIPWQQTWGILSEKCPELDRKIRFIMTEMIEKKYIPLLAIENVTIGMQIDEFLRMYKNKILTLWKHPEQWDSNDWEIGATHNAMYVELAQKLAKKLTHG